LIHFYKRTVVVQMILKGLLVLALAQCIVGPPVDKKVAEAEGGPKQNETQDWNLGLEYNKYLQEVVQILESDPEFRKKLETAKVDEIRDGTIAKELEFLNHGVRSKLDEVKRGELERLRHLAQKQYEMSQGIDRKHMKIPQHLEIKHPSFEVADLQRLIKQTTDDLEEADKERREDFKKYEMEKKFEKDMRLNAINDTQERKVVQEEMEKMQAKHKDHEKINHPMTKDQLEEVWEDQDHMDKQDWDPKTFFAMHDLDGNGQWDDNEVRVLFKKELDKAYDPNAPEDDMKEREEEMERMREHVFKESDTDKNHMISFDEFLAETKRDEYEKDEGWDTLDDENDLYTDEEFNNFEHERAAEVQRMMDAGQLPPGYPYPNIPAMPPVGYGHPGGYPQGYPQPNLRAPQYGAHPGQPMQHQFAPGPPIPGMDPNGVPMHGSVPGQPAQPQYVPGQPPHMQPGMPGQQQQFQQPPQQGGQYAGQPPQQGGQYAGQPPQQGGQYAGQPPQQGGQYAEQPPPPQHGGQYAGQPPQPGQFAAQPQPGQFARQPQQGQFAGQGQPIQQQPQPVQGGAPVPMQAQQAKP